MDGRRESQVHGRGRHAWRQELAGGSVFHRYIGSRSKGEATRALCIDGGGIRGLLPAMVLAEIEARSGRRACDLFDLIVGASTGSILALGAATPTADGTTSRWSAAEGVALYENRAHEIFAHSRISFGAFHEKYHHESFERLLDELWGETRLSEAIVECLATSYELTSRTVHHFDSRDAKKDPEFDLPIKRAVRAATAAPTFFDPARVRTKNGQHLFIDGAVYANNPSMIAFTAAQRFGPADMVIVSLGTGEETESLHWDTVRDWGFADWARPILHVAFDAASQAVDYQLRYLLGPERYHRFQALLPSDAYRLDDASPANIRRLKQHGEEMIADQSAEIDAVCSKLLEVAR